MKRNLLLLAALSCFANTKNHFPMTPLESPSIINSRSAEEKEQWGPENGWSWMELGLFHLDPMIITGFEFRDSYHFHSKWTHLLEGVTVQLGNKRCKVENGDVELTLDYVEPVDTLMHYYSHKYVGAGGYNAKSNKLYLDFEDDRLISVVNGKDTVYSLVYDNDEVLRSANEKGRELSISYIEDTVIVRDTSSHSQYYIYDSMGRLKRSYPIDSTSGDTMRLTDNSYDGFNSGYQMTSKSYSISTQTGAKYVDYVDTNLYNSAGICTDWYFIGYRENGDTSIEGKGDIELEDDNTILSMTWYDRDSTDQWIVYGRVSILKDENNSVKEVHTESLGSYKSHEIMKYTYYSNGWPSSIESLSFQEDGTWKQTSLDSIFYSGEPLGTIPVTKAEKSEVTVMQNGTDLLMTLPLELKSEPISLYTMNGRKIDEVSPVDGIAKISTKSLSSGVYFYRVRGAEGKFLVK